MHIAKFTITAILLIFLASSFEGRTAWGESQGTQDLLISYSLDSSQFTLHEPVILVFALKNNSDEAVRLNLGSNDVQNFQVTITPPHGRTLRLPRLSPEGLATVGLHLVAPGQEYRSRLVLNQWFPFSVEGTYRIEIQIIHPIESLDGSPALDPPVFHTRIEILPRDVARLSQVCGTLAQQVENASSYSAALEAALSLGYVQDPVAVPYLQRTLNAGHLVEGPSVHALMRIGSPEAVQVLISALGEDRQPNPDTPQMIKAALGMIAHETHDQTLRASIQAALQHEHEKTP